MGVSAAIAAVATIGSSVYSAREQKKSAEKARNAQEAQAMEARRIAASQKPMEETATMELQGKIGDNVLGSLGLMVEPDLEKRKKSLTGLGSTGGATGLGSTSATGSLGFGG
jgi:hypothetical protein